MSSEDDKTPQRTALFVSPALASLPQGFIDSILAPPDTIDTSDEAMRRLARSFTGPLRLVAHSKQPAASTTTGFRAMLTPVTAPEPEPPVAPTFKPGLSFMQQVSSIVGGEPATPSELAEAVFRVNLTPRNARIDIRPDSELTDRERLTITALARKFTRNIPPPTLEEPTQLAIWRGTAQALRF